MIPDMVMSGAGFSPCRRFRYYLSRVWNRDLPVLAIIGLNPSTADENTNDATIKKCITFAIAWGYGGILMLNLFAYCATDPRVLKAAGKKEGEGFIIGERNTTAIQNLTRRRKVLAAWGRPGTMFARDRYVMDLLHGNREVLCLGTNNDGTPKHPLYLPATTRMRRYSTIT